MTLLQRLLARARKASGRGDLAPAISEDAARGRIAFEDEARDARQRVLVLLLGHAPDVQAALARRIAVHAQARDREPVFVIDRPDFSAFAASDAIVELIPAAETLGESDAVHEAFSASRLACIRESWAADFEIDLSAGGAGDAAQTDLSALEPDPPRSD